MFVIQSQTDFFNLLETLSSAQAQDFLSFVRSPFHNRGELQGQCLQWLLEHPQQWRAGATPDEKILHRFLYGREALKPQRLRRLMMELRELLSRYLALRTPGLLRSEDFLRQLRWLLDHNFLPAFEKNCELFLQSQSHTHDPFDSVARMWALQMKNEFLIHTRATTDVFEQQAEELDYFYLCKKLESIASMLTREKQFPQVHHIAHRQQVMHMASSMDEARFPLVAMWLAVIGLEEAPGDWRHFEKLAALVPQHAAELQPVTLRQLRGYMFNFLLRAQPTGVDVYAQLWSLMAEMEAEGTLFLHDMISPPFFISAIRSACLSGQVAWARDFLQRHAPRLSGDQPQATLAYLNMMVCHYEGRTYEAWRMSLSFHTSDVRIEIWVRVLQVQLCYETGRADDFFRLLRSLRTFLKRHPEAGEKASRHYVQFATWAARLGQYAFRSEVIPHSIHSAINLSETAEKFWLLEKCRQPAEW